MENSWLDWKRQGNEHLKNDRWPEAVDCFTSAIRMESDDAILYSLRATCHMKLREYQLARQDAETAIRLDAKNIKFHCILTESLIGLRLFDEALEACDEGLKVDGREPHLIIRRKDCLEKLSRRMSSSSLTSEDRQSNVSEYTVDSDEGASGEYQIHILEIWPITDTRSIQELRLMANQQFEPLMIQRSMAGSPTAKLFCEAAAKAAQARLLLGQNLFDDAFQMIQEAWRTWDHSICDDGPFITAAVQVLRSQPTNHRALSVALYCDDIDADECMRMARLCVQMDPQNADYHYNLSRMHIIGDDYEQALVSCDRAIELLPHPFFLYIRAQIIEGLDEAPPERVIDAYQTFLSSAPPDYPKVAETFYCIGFQYFILDDAARAAALYRRAREAEDPSVRLPYFVGLENFWPRMCLEDYLTLKGLWPIQIHAPPDVDICPTCARTNPTLLCSTCRNIKYCSSQCQINNLYVHKRICTNE